MITITPQFQNGTVKLGQHGGFEIRSRGPVVETRPFLSHEGVRYLKPLRDWSTDTQLDVFAESPGSYSLDVQWRDADGRTGWVRCPFGVRVTRSTDWAPHLARHGQQGLWTPSKWEAGHLVHGEDPVMQIVEREVQSGAVAYDLGANVGLYATLLARLAGSEGHVYCIEANPVCVYFLRANLALTGQDNYTILPVAVSNGDGEVGFTVNYGNSSLGIAQGSAFYGTKSGHEVTVHAAALDDLIERHELRPPDFVKIDIEGAEVLAVEGMQRTLRAARPTLLLELHGKQLGIQVLRLLEAAGYGAQDAVTGATFANADDAAARLSDGIWRILARPEGV